MKIILVKVWHIILLTFSMVLSIAIAGSLFFEINPNQNDNQASVAVMILFLTSLINSIILMILLSRSNIRGIKLIILTYTILWGTNTLLSQLDSLYYKSSINISSADIFSVIYSGTLADILFSVFAVLILGKIRGKSKESKSNILQVSNKKWVLGIVVLPVIYMLLYFLFGYFIAWQVPDVRLYYSGSVEIEPFISHMANTVQEDPLIILFQIFRGLLWVIIALLVLNVMEGKWWEKSIIIALLLGFVQTSQLLIPNPYMPEVVRQTHFIEISVSTFIFGLITGIYFSKILIFQLSDKVELS